MHENFHPQQRGVNMCRNSPLQSHHHHILFCLLSGVKRVCVWKFSYFTMYRLHANPFQLPATFYLKYYFCSIYALLLENEYEWGKVLKAEGGHLRRCEIFYFTVCYFITHTQITLYWEFTSLTHATHITRMFKGGNLFFLLFCFEKNCKVTKNNKNSTTFSFMKIKERISDLEWHWCFLLTVLEFSTPRKYHNITSALQ